MLLGRKNQYCDNDYTTKRNLQIQWYQIANDIFHRTRTKNFTIHMKTQRPQSSLEREEWSWRNQPSWLQIILQSYSHQDSMVLSQKQKYWPMEQDGKPINKPMHLWVPYLFFLLLRTNFIQILCHISILLNSNRVLVKTRTAKLQKQKFWRSYH